MYYNDHTAPCRPFLTVGTCPGGASSSLTEAISACGNLLKIICKKCAENLEVCEIRINTHTHTHTLSLSRHARQDTNYLLIVNALARALFPVLTGFSICQHLNYHIPPPFSVASGKPCLTAICEVQSVPVCRRPALCPNPRNQNPIYE